MTEDEIKGISYTLGYNEAMKHCEAQVKAGMKEMYLGMMDFRKEVKKLFALDWREKLKQEENEWRALLWNHHGCENMCLYGDDGEMQCNAFKHKAYGFPSFPDFKRDSANLLKWKLANDEYRKIFPRPEGGR